MKILGTFFITLLIAFFVWITNGWIFLLIIILPLFFWSRRKIKGVNKRNESLH